MGILHAKVSTVADGSDPSQVQPSDWNAEHVVSMFYVGEVTAAALAAMAGPAVTGKTIYVDEYDAHYQWVLGAVTAIDGFRIIGHTGGSAGRWVLISGSIRLAPSKGATWTTVLAARAAMAYHGKIRYAAEAWTMDVGVTGVTSCPNGVHEYWEDGATLNITLGLSAGTVAQNGPWYSNGGVSAPIASTTLNGNIAAGATSLVVTSNVDFVAERWFRIRRGVAYVRTYKIKSVVGTTINFDRPLRRPFNNGDTIEVITAARDITIEGNGLTVTGSCDALVELVSGVNCHFLDIKSRLTSAKFNFCFDLGCRDCTADNLDIDGNAAIPSAFLVHNTEACDLYDCIGLNVGGAGTPTVMSFCSNDNSNDWSGTYTKGTRCGVLDVEDVTDTFGNRGCTFNGTYWAGATSAVVEVKNSSSFNVFIGCEASDGQTGFVFTGGNGPAIGNLLKGCQANRNSQVAIGANSAAIVRAEQFSGTGNVAGFANVDTLAEIDFAQPHVNDTSAAAAGRGLIYVTAGTARVTDGYATTARNAMHFMQVDGATAVGIISGAFRYVVTGGAANVALILCGTAGSRGRIAGPIRLTSCAFGVFMNNATACCRIGGDVDLSGAVTPIQLSAGTVNRGTFTLSGASPSLASVSFPDTKATDRIFVTRKTAGGTAGPQPTWVNTPGTGFAMTGGNADTSVYEYEIR